MFLVPMPGWAPYLPEALALFAAMTTPATSARKTIINTCIGSLKSAGVWSKMDLLYLLAAADSQAAGLNWKNPGSFTLNPVSSPSFAADRGFTGNGTSSYLDTGWDPATNGVQITQNSAHVGVYGMTAGTTTNSEFGTGTSTSIRDRVVSGTAGGVGVNSGSLTTGTAAVYTPPFHQMGIRRDASNQLLFRDGVQDKTQAVASTALSSSDLNVLRGNTTGFSDHQVGAVHIGGQLSDPEALALYDALHSYMVAIGADT